LIIINADLGSSRTISRRALRERTSGWAIGARYLIGIDIDQVPSQSLSQHANQNSSRERHQAIAPSDHAGLATDAGNDASVLTLPPAGLLAYRVSESQHICIDAAKRK